MFRFEYLKWLCIQLTSPPNIKTAAIACVIIGLSVRVFASLVPPLPVHIHPEMHYCSAGMLFLTIGVYMLMEVNAIDPLTKCEDTKPQIRYRKCICAMYWFASICGAIFFCVSKFFKLELWAFSSIGELVAMLCSELYLLTYLTSFTILDKERPYLQF